MLAFLGEQNMNLLAHPPYSPDLAPCDYFLFPRVKKKLGGVRHANVQVMKAAVLKVLKKISPEDFATALMSLPIHWMKCVSADGEYFEGHHLPIDPAVHGLEIVFGEDTDSESSSSDQETSAEDEETL